MRVDLILTAVVEVFEAARGPSLSELERVEGQIVQFLNRFIVLAEEWHANHLFISSELIVDFSPCDLFVAIRV